MTEEIYALILQKLTSYEKTYRNMKGPDKRKEDTK